MDHGDPFWNGLMFRCPVRSRAVLRRYEEQYGAFKDWDDLKSRANNVEMLGVKGCGSCVLDDIRNTVSRCEVPTPPLHDELYERVVFALIAQGASNTMNLDLLNDARVITDGIRAGGPHNGPAGPQD